MKVSKAKGGRGRATDTRGRKDMNFIRGALLASVLALPVHAQETINLTVASSHPTVVPWVGFIQSHFMAKTDELLAKTGNYKIEWNEAFGGQLYKANATLSSVEEGDRYRLGLLLPGAGQAAVEPGLFQRAFRHVEPAGAARNDAGADRQQRSLPQRMGKPQPQGARADGDRPL
ncbi:hypothetical protein ACFSZS_18100 [Seohaeicola zhoushanensis]